MFSRLIAMALLAATLIAQQADEYNVKAAFLYNFAKFVDWPAESFLNPTGPLTICVLGEDPFDRALDEFVAGKTIGGRPFAVRRVSDFRQTGACQMLFVGSSANKRALSFLAADRQPGVLTVGDTELAASEGLIIRFTMVNGRVHFEIDAPAASRAGLHISAKLLSLAQADRRPEGIAK